VMPPLWSHAAGFVIVAAIAGIQWLGRAPASGGRAGPEHERPARESGP